MIGNNIILRFTKQTPKAYKRKASTKVPKRDRVGQSGSLLNQRPRVALPLVESERDQVNANKNQAIIFDSIRFAIEFHGIPSFDKRTEHDYWIPLLALLN